MRDRRILAIDTSTAVAGVALMVGDTVRAELTWTARGNHSRTLMPALDRLFAFEETVPSDLDVVAVANGPGSFSGIRVGISVAKGLAMALNIPLVGVSTLDTIGLQASSRSADVWAVLPAGRNQVYAARYVGGWHEFERHGEYRLIDIEAVGDLIGEGFLIGESANEIAARMEHSSQAVRREPFPWNSGRAGFLAELGRRYLEAGGPDQRDVLEPLYLRLSAAEENRAAAE